MSRNPKDVIYVKPVKAPAPHKTRRIAVKSADVDIGIVPVVRWLNSFGTVVTNAACQGVVESDRPDLFEHFSEAYVAFSCSNLLDLAKILDEIGSTATTEVRYDNQSGCLSYCSRFHSPASLEWFCSLQSVKAVK